jgi:putative ubiquitin-RnfH superfamily antitoxin RatB of RatAB toxin-antitoxin module
VNVTVVWATPEIQDVVTFELAAGATIAEAVERSGLLNAYALDRNQLQFAIFGRRADAATQLKEGDRVELTRPLTVDPKLARALRARKGRALTKGRQGRSSGSET